MCSALLWPGGCCAVAVVLWCTTQSWHKKCDWLTTNCQIILIFMHQAKHTTINIFIPLFLIPSFPYVLFIAIHFFRRKQSNLVCAPLGVLGQSVAQSCSCEGRWQHQLCPVQPLAGPCRGLRQISSAGLFHCLLTEKLKLAISFRSNENENFAYFMLVALEFVYK